MSFSFFKLFSIALYAPSVTVVVLSITVGFFFVLLILGVRKSYKLKKESERLIKKVSSSKDKEDSNDDFTEGHLYQNH
ncbi:MAG: hypothetical protein KC469_09720 [Flavobacteriaceae bacterium]|nr:hypothetical protein [Flavobacteriaceae bacterium]